VSGHAPVLQAAEDPPAEIRGRERSLSYNERLAARVLRRDSLLCAGLDPSPDAVRLLSDDALDSRTQHAAAIERFCGFVIESARDHAVAVKPQLAWFELAGWPGMRALERTVAYARAAGMLVVLDAKRGDVPHSAAAYADAWLGADAPSGSGGDALTVNISVGSDSLAAMAEIAHARRCGLYALVHTSNPGALELQNAELGDGTRWWQRLAGAVAAHGVGAVVGATHESVLAEARVAMPGAALLLPGVGAQGASMQVLTKAATPGSPPSLVPVSRGLLPRHACDVGAFRHHVAQAARSLAEQSAPFARLTAPAG